MPTHTPSTRLRHPQAGLVTVLLVLSLLAALLVAGGAAPARAEQGGSAERRVAAASVDTSIEHTCVLLTTGAVRCWGINTFGQLGYAHTRTIGDNEAVRWMGTVQLRERATAVSAGENHTCALLASGAVRCWGQNTWGQLGRGTGDLTPVGDDEVPGEVPPVDLGGRAIAISAGLVHTCAVLASGRVRCWGADTDGELGSGDSDGSSVGDDETPATLPPVDLGGARATAVSAGASHTCALLTSGKVRCWGNDTFGQLGSGDGDPTPVGDDETPAALPPVDLGGARATAVSAGSFHTCVILTKGNVRCWGSDDVGQLGSGDGDPTSVGDDETPASMPPVDLGATKVTAVSAGASHTCVVLAGGKVHCWGLGFAGMLGYGNTNTVGDDEVPAVAGAVDVGGDAAAVATGEDHSCAVLTGGPLRCWGFNDAGELGHGNTTPVGDNEVPAQVAPVDLPERVRVRAPSRLTATVSPGRDRRAPYVYRVRGSVVPVGAVADAATCTGALRVVMARGGRRVAATSATLRPDCTFSTSVAVKASKVGRKPARLTTTVRYRGTPNLTPAKVRARVTAG